MTHLDSSSENLVTLWYKRIQTYKCILLSLFGTFILVTPIFIFSGECWESGELPKGCFGSLFPLISTLYFIIICGIFITMAVTVKLGMKFCGTGSEDKQLLLDNLVETINHDFEASVEKCRDFQENIIITQQQDLHKLALDLA